MNLQERRLFWESARKNIGQVGSLIPSSQAVAWAMTAVMRETPAPRHILEVGAGTGPITARIVREMKHGDVFHVYEIDPAMSAFLARRFDTEPAFQRMKAQTTIFTAPIQSIEPVPTYDIIISAVPFTNLPPSLVEEFFETYRKVLKPKGALTFIEFAFGRAIYQMAAKGEEKERLQKVGEVVKRYQKTYQFRARFVPLNVPPAWIRSLRFD